jgi:hypothetical protein
MLYCSLISDGIERWNGVPCLNGVNINSAEYLDFEGALVFLDTMGTSDPDYTGLSSRFVLLYIVDGQDNVQIPLQDLPYQEQSIILNDQNCVITFQHKDTIPLEKQTTHVTIFAPASALVTDVLAASASPVMSSYLWSITNGTILSGQGTATITYQASSVAPVILSLYALMPQGGETSATATTQIYGPASFAISAPEYVWAGEFDIHVSVPYSGSGFSWSPSGGVRVLGDPTSNATTIDIGKAGMPAVLAATVNGLAITVWNFKVVPFTSGIVYTSNVIEAGGFEDFTIELGWQYQIHNMATDYPALVRVYQTAAARTADAGRDVLSDPNVDPSDASVIVFEGETASDLLSFALTHSAIGTNGDTPRLKTAYCRIFNRGESFSIINLTLTRTELQASNSF